MTPELEALLEEWFTGRDAGKESTRFASRWQNARAGGFASRVYTPHLGDLNAAVRAQSTAYRTSVALVVGVDDLDDIRVETEEAGSVLPAELRMTQIHVDGTMALASEPRTIDPSELGKKTVERWRPVSGSLDRVVGHDGQPRGALAVAVKISAAEAVAVDTLATDSRAVIDGKRSALRAARALLREKREALEYYALDTTPVDDALAAIAVKNDAAVVEFDARKSAERATRVAETEARAQAEAEEVRP